MTFLLTHPSSLASPAACRELGIGRLPWAFALGPRCDFPSFKKVRKKKKSALATTCGWTTRPTPLQVPRSVPVKTRSFVNHIFRHHEPSRPRLGQGGADLPDDPPQHLLNFLSKVTEAAHQGQPCVSLNVPRPGHTRNLPPVAAAGLSCWALMLVGAGALKPLGLSDSFPLGDWNLPWHQILQSWNGRVRNCCKCCVSESWSTTFASVLAACFVHRTATTPSLGQTCYETESPSSCDFWSYGNDVG